MRNFSPVSEMRKGQRSWDEFWRQIRETKQTWRNITILTSGPTIASVTLKAVSLHCAVKWDDYDVENTAGNAGRCPPDHQNLSRRS